MPDTRIRDKVTAALLWAGSAVLGVYVLKALRIIALPLTFAFIVVLLIYPVQRWTNARLSGRFIWPGVIVALALYLGLLFVFGGMIKNSFIAVTQNIRWYIDRLPAFADGLFAWARAHHLPLQPNLAQESRILSEIAGLAGSWISRSGSVVTEFVVSFFLVLLMLLEAGEWETKLAVLFGRHTAVTASRVLAFVSHDIRLLLLIRTLVSLLIGAAGGLWLWFLGADDALAWGVLIYLFNYIPYIGSIAIMLPPTLLVLIRFGVARALLAFAGLTVIHMIIGNYVEPRWEGRALTISPIVIFLSVVFWGWLWGVWGAFLSIPLTIVFIIACAHIPALRPVAALLRGGAAGAKAPPGSASGL